LSLKKGKKIKLK